MSTGEPHEADRPQPGAEAGRNQAGGQGWTQFGPRPPAAGEFRRGAAQGEQAPWGAGNRPDGGTAVFATAPGGPARRQGFTMRQKTVAGLALAAMAIVGGAAGAFAATAFSDGRPVQQQTVASPVFSPASNARTVADVAQAVQPSVVSIRAGDAEGSGVVLTSDGLILTNNHVVASAGPGSAVTVRFNDGKSIAGSVKGTDPSTDIAVVQAQGVSGLSKAALGDSGALKVGDSVLAIGSPLGLEGSVTAGIVSALNRTLTVGDDSPQQQLPPGWGQMQGGEPDSTPTTIGGAIQTDAAINPGNSGGALVNAAGQVIGINTAIATNGGQGNIGVGFAIPINTAKRVADQLIADGTAKHALLGVGVGDSTTSTAGAVVSSVTGGGPAEKAGLQEGDIITKIGNQPIDGADAVIGVVRGFQPGDKVAITYVRGGQTHTADVTLTEKTDVPMS
ncbi:hypothetical protein Misp01_17900 [Microtetraspora sp. NBRC 13810]|uniref:S1C family serine protease n=1 Tax=Microtetraspora sp. NBRC 13810 TaxID=3030990 RepID=UPI0024A3ECB8|nr:trypsin-like peptidase domain-containing protein [Microtetraspora sp. NBRC 13810]GLW06660.1 hypothetical protein Misp01_17900 [Microtetraspora sp. NBRC 13810]